MLVKRDVTRREIDFNLTTEQIEEARRMIEEAVVPYNFEEIKFEADDQPHEQVYQQAVNEELAKIKKLEKAIE